MDELWKKLLLSYPPVKKAWDGTYPWIYYIARPVSFPISWLLLKAGATANHVTVLTAALGFASVPLLACGRPGLMALGAFCLVLYTVFDCVDGDMARAFPETGSPAGQYWGELVGNFYLICYIPLAAGLGGEWPVLGALVTVCKLLIISIRNNFWQTLGGLWEKSKQTSGYVPYTGSWYYKLYYNLTDPQAHVFLLPILILAGFGKQFIAASLLISGFDLIFIIVFYLVRAGKIGSQKGQVL
ncbi:MAG: CDP-alcohol phosphatidyltransferase family protein [Elusimicrobiota bacterium]|nr:CDP-alcohol phosphatidyltransferase family protein [Elusimicrobiota bacterium]